MEIKAAPMQQNNGGRVRIQELPFNYQLEMFQIFVCQELSPKGKKVQHEHIVLPKRQGEEE